MIHIKETALISAALCCVFPARRERNILTVHITATLQGVLKSTADFLMTATIPMQPCLF